MSKFIITNDSNLPMYEALELVQITIKQAIRDTPDEIKYLVDFKGKYLVVGLEDKCGISFYVYQQPTNGGEQ